MSETPAIPMPLLPLDRETFVYFIQPEGGGLVKIGRADDPQQRLKELQCGSPVVLRLCRTVKAPVEMEQRLHGLFRKYRKHGEWFEPCPMLASIADAIADPVLTDDRVTPDHMGDAEPALRVRRRQDFLDTQEWRTEWNARRNAEREARTPEEAAFARPVERPVTALPDDVDPEWHWDHSPRRYERDGGRKAA